MIQIFREIRIGIRGKLKRILFEVIQYPGIFITETSGSGNADAGNKLDMGQKLTINPAGNNDSISCQQPAFSSAAAMILSISDKTSRASLP